MEVDRAHTEIRVGVEGVRVRDMGGEIRPEFEPQPGDVVASEHWCSSGFANTDLDLLLKRHRVHKLIVAGMIAHVRRSDGSLRR